MTTLHGRPQALSYADSAEALIEEARRRQRRRRFVLGVATAILGAGAVSYVATGGNGGRSIPRAGGANTLSDPVSSGSTANSSGGMNAFLASCALESLQLGIRQSIPSDVRFTEVRSGISDSQPWSFWWAATGSAEPYLAMIAGSGTNALCVQATDGFGITSAAPHDKEAYGWYGIAQLPGKPIAFVFGDVPPTSTLSRLSAVVNGRSTSMVPQHIRGSRYRLLFADVTGLTCATSPTQLAGIFDATTEYSGDRNIGSSSGPAGLDSLKTAVPCGAAVAPLGTLTADLASAPAPLRAAVLRTIAAPSVAIDAVAEHSLSAKTWVTQRSAYGSPDRYRGPYQPAHCGQVGGYSGTVVTVDVGSSEYQVHENCVNGRVLTSGRRGPSVEHSVASGEYGMTAAQVAAFGGLLTAIRTATSFRPIDGGYAYVSDMNPVVGNYVTGGPPTSGTITVSDGHLTSVSASSYRANCEPLGPACQFTSSTMYAASGSPSGISVPIASDYLGPTAG